MSISYTHNVVVLIQLAFPSALPLLQESVLAPLPALCILLGFSPDRRQAMLLCPRAVARSPAVLPLMSHA